MMQAEKKQAALNAFQMQDLDRSGYIDVREFYAALSAMGLGLSWVCA
jgi:Ca2+-binding EF-hand superfamily protein